MAGQFQRHSSGIRGQLQLAQYPPVPLLMGAKSCWPGHPDQGPGTWVFTDILLTKTCI